MALKFNKKEEKPTGFNSLAQGQNVDAIEFSKKLYESMGNTPWKVGSKDIGVMTVLTPNGPKTIEVSSVTVVQKEPHTFTTPIKEISEEEALINEYLVLYKIAEEQEMKKHLDRMDSIRKQLQLIAQKDPPDHDVVFTTDAGTLYFSKCTQTTEITKKSEVLDFINENFGEEAMLSVIKVGITELKKILSPKELEKFGEQKWGSRSLKSVLLKEQE